MNHSNRRENRKGVALVAVLVVVALLTILVVAFMTTSRTELRSSTSFADTQRAKLVAKGAVAHAVEILRNNIPEPAGIDQSAETSTAMNWAINPGRLTVIDELHSEETVDLHTGAADIDPDNTRDPDVYSVDLNEPVPGKVDSDDQPVPTITYALDGSGNSDRNQALPQMRVKWVNILKDPSREASENNPIIARHAFWMDDESGKINFNTAMGKPDPLDDLDFEQQLALKMMPPLFSGGEGSKVAVTQEYNKKGQPVPKEPRQFGVGSSRSVNLDVLMDDPADLDKDELMAQTTLRGFSRYPEAILEFITLIDPAERDRWWNENRYNLTSYSRSPEFNVFGRPRLMTTWAPLSLEGGPTYQSPFVFNDGSGPASSEERIEGILHLSGLLGTLKRNMGTARVGETNDGEDGPIITSRAVVNRYQLEMLRKYFYREFPGYQGTFVGKLGGDVIAEREAAQIALNMMAMAYYGTAPIAYDHDNKTSRNARKNAFPQALVEHLASVNNFPNSEQAVDRTPERYYWWYEDGLGFLANPPEELEDNPNAVTAIPMLPVHPGPFITEVRMLFRPEEVPPENPNDPGEERRFRLSIELQAEYYLPGVMGRIDLKYFPFKMDYINIEGDGVSLLDLGTEGSGRNWDNTFYRNRRGAKNRLSAPSYLIHFVTKMIQNPFSRIDHA